MSTSSRWLLCLSMVLSAAGGCKLNAVPAPSGCVSDSQCDSSSACTNGACIPRASRGTWAVELVPQGDSSAAPTQLGAVSFSDGPNVLMTDAKVTVLGTLPVGHALAGGSRVIATVQTPIPGHSDPQFETDWLLPAGAAAPPPFSITVPASLLGQTATFRITPLPPRDDGQAPITLQAKLAPTIDLTPIDDSYYVSGRLVTPDLMLSGGFVARALIAGQLVSNAPKVNTSTGQFRLGIPKQAVTAGQAITVEITPSGSQYSTPRFTTPPIVLSSDVMLGDLNLPAIGLAGLFRFKVVGADQQPVFGAIVRARTVIASDESGASDLVRDGTSDVNGNADLPLIPGRLGGAQSYDVSVIPPPSSPFGIACVSSVAISGDGSSPSTGEPSVVAQLALPTKVKLSGTILSADSFTVAGVAITATRTKFDPTTTCGSAIVAPRASASSGPDGVFQLMVDPGTYRLDLDPPAGSSVPRLTETGVVVTRGAGLTHVVELPSGALLKGSVRSANGRALPSVDVRLFEIVCSGQDSCFGAMREEPVLRAETHTDSDGTFRAVVPLASP